MSLHDSEHTLGEEIAAFSSNPTSLEDDVDFQSGQNDVIGLKLSLSMLRRRIPSERDNKHMQITATRILEATGNAKLGALQTLKIILEDQPENGQQLLSYLATIDQTLPPHAA